MHVGFHFRKSLVAVACIAIAFGLLAGIPIPRKTFAEEFPIPLAAGNSAADTSETDQELARTFEAEILPLFSKYCMDCHDSATAEAKLDMSIFRSPSDIDQAWGSWQAILSRVHEKEMPPADAGELPSDEERKRLADWASRFRTSEAARRAGDPGPISTRRLSNSEYNYSIRDLTGVDIKPTASFPIDAANAAGFDNSAESLTISPSLINKYLDAARSVADHMLLTPDGIRFAPHPVVTDTDRDKYCVQRIVDFYRAQPTALDAYLLAAWEGKRESLSPGADRWVEFARARKLSPRYLTTIWEHLHDVTIQWGPSKELQRRWNALPSDREKSDTVERECKEIAKWIEETRRPMRVRIANLNGARGMNGGSQPLVLWKNRKMAASRRLVHHDAINPDTKDCVLSEAELAIMKSDRTEAKEAVQRDYEKFGAVFPDTFLVLERGRAHISEEEAAREAKGRLLSAGFHSMMGFFRDDQPLCELILDEEQKRQLDRLWEELNFISHVPTRQYSGFIWFERAEASFINDPAFHFVRAEDKSALSQEMIDRFANAYLNKLEGMESSSALREAVAFHFKDCNTRIRAFETEWKDARPKQLTSLLEFAGRAFRRPLSDRDRERILQYYDESLQQSSGDHRAAMEDTLVTILVSPSYLYRWDLQGVSSQSEDDVREEGSESKQVSALPIETTAIGTTGQSMVPLRDEELASRLSYFLWSSTPDPELMELARQRRLSDPEVLVAQSRRMLADPRAKSMLLEFLGNWLDFRRFDQHQAVDRNQFSSFDDELRNSMWQEPIEFLHYLIQNEGTVAGILDADYMILDGRLAAHYGVKNAPPVYERKWSKFPEAKAYQRGGILSMAVFLTQNSPGLRTSPVKRGYWVVRRLLGELIPPPPPNVPELPNSDQQLGDKTLREALAIHREHPSCAACHNRFDSAGLLLEGFDPIGRPRDKDLVGRPVQTDATLPNGEEAIGIEGLRSYIEQHRMKDFRRHFCESLLAFALGRTLILADDVQVDELVQSLQNNGDRISTVFERIVLSQPFRYKRLQTVTSDEGVSR
ncbi:hypothetical protein VN12_02870 [Pirellula sp. SH-Sr6A]|nr:hypothetical protein VN12_02870 [Pirellula sp. SH-Sr6A]